MKHLENYIDSDPKLQKAPVNYEGVSFFMVNVDFIATVSILVSTWYISLMLPQLTLGNRSEFPAMVVGFFLDSHFMILYFPST